MVGRKTSLRCETCRKRKIKCDLTAPSCSQCQKAGWRCPGYDRHALFHPHDIRALKQLHVHHGSRTPNVIHEELWSPTDSLRAELISKSRAGRLSARFVVIPESRIVDHLPCRLGADRALDDAVRLICCSEPRAYGNALRSLQRSVQVGPSSEAVGAATLLHMHDLFQGPQSPTWAMHANGVRCMLQARGPAGLRTKFDVMLLQAQVGNITFDALRERNSCFLETPEWNEKLRASGSWGLYGGNEQRQARALIAAGVRMPGLVCRFEDFQRRMMKVEEKHCSHAGEESFLQELCHMRLDIEGALMSGLDDSSTESPAGERSSDRIHAALRLSTGVFLVMIDYMLDEVQEGNDGGKLHRAEAALEYMSTAIKLSYERLWAVDTVALQSTAELLLLTLGRVLDAADPKRRKMGLVTTVLRETCRLLTSHAHEYTLRNTDSEEYVKQFATC